MPTNAHTHSETTRTHGGYIDAWLAQVAIEHYAEPGCVLAVLALCDLYADQIRRDPACPVGVLDEIADEGVVVAGRVDAMLADGRLHVFPGLIEWDRPWPLRPAAGRAEGPDWVLLYVGVPASN